MQYLIPGAVGNINRDGDPITGVTIVTVNASYIEFERPDTQRCVIGLANIYGFTYTGEGSVLTPVLADGSILTPVDWSSDPYIYYGSVGRVFMLQHPDESKRSQNGLDYMTIS